MNTCPCIKSVKTLVTTGKWHGAFRECGKNVPPSHLIIAGVVGLILTTVVDTMLMRLPRD